MDYRIAEFVRVVDRLEEFDEVVNEAKSDTWSKAREHAVLLLADGRLVLVRGGKDGIVLIDRAEDGLAIEMNQQVCRIESLAWHTHPVPTGPSDHDRAILARLGQESSVIYELRGDPRGTRFGPK